MPTDSALLKRLFPKPNGSLTDAIAVVESSFGKRERTHDGNCQGWHMMSRRAWQDVNDYRTLKMLPTKSWDAAFDYQASTAYCTDYLRQLAGKLAVAKGRPATRREILCAYRLGFTRFKHLNFNPDADTAYCIAVEKHLQ